MRGRDPSVSESYQEGVEEGQAGPPEEGLPGYEEGLLECVCRGVY